MTITRGVAKRSVLWHPAKFCVENSLEEPQAAMRAVRASVMQAVRAQAARHSSILVRLSGGLDSSIVTSCLPREGDNPHTTCLNFYIPSDGSDEAKGLLLPGFTEENLAKLRRVIAAADEREFARKVATRCGFRLIEREKRVADYDLEKIWNAPLSPRPTNYIFVIDEDQVESECAKESGASACFTGEAGDTVFFNTLRAIGAPDYAYLHGISRSLLSHIDYTVRLSGESIGTVLGKVIKYGFLRRRVPLPYELMKQPHLLVDDVAAGIPADYFRHPWVDMVPSLCPGKVTHVIGVATSVATYHHAYHRERLAPAVNPLSSQPVVETCLRIPSYVLSHNGISRGLARHAFRELLPVEVVGRTVKGTSIGFWQRLVRHNIKYIRDCLLDGRLTREGLLDRRKLDVYLTANQPFITVQPQQIMDYLSCEAWLAQWTSS
ncbi:MAG: asparagine synthase-related protein [Steroidobacteraceae bacterium]